MTDFDFTAAYKLENHAGIAWRATSYKKEYDFSPVYDEDGEYTGYDDYEEYDDKSQVICHMIGDDVDFTFYVDELIKIDESEYCPECGQIGCKAYD